MKKPKGVRSSMTSFKYDPVLAAERKLGGPLKQRPKSRRLIRITVRISYRRVAFIFYEAIAALKYFEAVRRADNVDSAEMVRDGEVLDSFEK